MPCRSKIISQLNKNACNETENHVISHIETVGNLIVKEVKGLERDYLKQKLGNSSISNSTLSSSRRRRSLKQVLDDFHHFTCHIEREHRTIGIGDHDVNKNLEMSKIPKRKIKRTNVIDSSPIIDNEKEKSSTTITRTICTRSSKLNSLSNNQESTSHEVLPNPTRKRRSCSKNNIDTQNSISKTDNIIEKSKEDNTSNKKLRSSTSSSIPVEC